jgi:hypothetical protein
MNTIGTKINSAKRDGIAREKTAAIAPQRRHRGGNP